jgi:hypothetical protein
MVIAAGVALRRRSAYAEMALNKWGSSLSSTHRKRLERVAPSIIGAGALFFISVGLFAVAGALLT